MGLAQRPDVFKVSFFINLLNVAIHALWKLLNRYFDSVWMPG